MSVGTSAAATALAARTGDIRLLRTWGWPFGSVRVGRTHPCAQGSWDESLSRAQYVQLWVDGLPGHMALESYAVRPSHPAPRRANSPPSVISPMGRRIRASSTARRGTGALLQGGGATAGRRLGHPGGSIRSDGGTAALADADERARHAPTRFTAELSCTSMPVQHETAHECIGPHSRAQVKVARYR